MGQVYRRKFILTLATGALSIPWLSVAQQPPAGKFRIGFLVPGSEISFASRLRAFKQGLNELGYVDGNNVIVECRWADGNYERLATLAAELVRLKMDVIVAQTTPSTRAVQRATSAIPVVMVSVGDPIGSGLVASLARPGGNITGLTNVTGDTSKKQLDLLIEAVPKLSEVAVLVNPNNESLKGILRSVQAAGQTVGAKVTDVSATTPEEIERAFSTMKQSRAQALVVLGDGFFLQQRVQIVALAAKARIPAIYNLREYAEVGGLMSYGASAVAISRRAAIYVDKILKGANPMDIPVEQPNTLELVINQKAVNALGLTFPNALLVRADEVIE